MARAPQTRVLTCYHCRRRFEAGAQAISLTCPGCHKRLSVADVVISDSRRVRSIETCGRVVVDRRGSVVAGSIVACDGLEVWGQLEARVTSYGPVAIAARARWKGDLVAPALDVQAGAAVVDGFFRIGSAGTPAGATAGAGAA